MRFSGRLFDGDHLHAELGSALGQCTQDTLANFNMTFFWLVFALGFLYVTALIGDVYGWTNPWRTLCDAIAMLMPATSASQAADCTSSVPLGASNDPAKAREADAVTPKATATGARSTMSPAGMRAA